MKKQTKKPAPVPAPAFNGGKAEAVTPYRAEDANHKRTACYHQAAGEGQVHRFTSTGAYIDTVDAKVAPATKTPAKEAS